jgi:NTP pyrophosphatase (non-canonical NTP hydrolase)
MSSEENDLQSLETFDGYQEGIDTFARYQGGDGMSVYPVLGLCGESCELAGKFVSHLPGGTVRDTFFLLEEVGCYTELIKKVIRDDQGMVGEAKKREILDALEDIVLAANQVRVQYHIECPIVDLESGVVTWATKEGGDCLWYLSRVATELRKKFSEIAVENWKKLRGRRERGTLSGSGDDR